jgi:hypothetical protein
MDSKKESLINGDDENDESIDDDNKEEGRDEGE